ncbi:hypothetical protein FKP32DRAFT_1664183 [Trametes sanguinea]|nr:hypothetical protein FKP32DRAFT_1664183 [Trametes sanguinea]
MSADAPEKSSRKHKKAKLDNLAASEEPQDSAKKSKRSKKAKAAEPVADIEEEHSEAQPAPAAEVAKPKKEKKRKEREAAADEPVETKADAEEPKKKKKKRKHEESTSASAPAEQSAPPPAESTTKPSEGVKSKDEKKEKKGKKAKKAGESGKGAAPAAEPDSSARGDVGPAAQSEARPAQDEKTKKKDKKKRKKGASDGDDADGQKPAKEGMESSSKREKKRRRRTTSGFPDPTDDEALTEQAQKALHYAFTQFEEPGSWKFNKARQNWLIRNLWSEEAIPETYIALVSRYLQGVQGGAREALIKSCREALQPATSTSKPQPTEKSADAVDTENPESPSKRTVKFAEPEPISSTDTSNAADEIKRRRASALLAALTSS